jgi:hypothetical protein
MLFWAKNYVRKRTLSFGDEQRNIEKPSKFEP